MRLFATTWQADKIVKSMQSVISSAKLREDDPFLPTTKATKPHSEVLGRAEMNRDHVIAVQMIGSGQFGEVYLATQVRR